MVYQVRLPGLSIYRIVIIHPNGAFFYPISEVSIVLIKESCSFLIVSI